MSTPTPPTLVDDFWQRAEAEPDRPLFAWVDDSGAQTGSLTHGELVLASEAVASHLLGTAGLKAGDRILLAYPPGLDFIPALFACLRAGLVPVPVCPPRQRPSPTT